MRLTSSAFTRWASASGRPRSAKTLPLPRSTVVSVAFMASVSTMRVTVVPLGGGQALADQVEFLLRRRDAPPGLLLEGMQDVDGGLEPDRVDGPEGVAVVARDDFEDSRAEPL